MKLRIVLILVFSLILIGCSARSQNESKAWLMFFEVVSHDDDDLEMDISQYSKCYASCAYYHNCKKPECPVDKSDYEHTLKWYKQRHQFASNLLMESLSCMPDTKSLNDFEQYLDQGNSHHLYNIQEYDQRCRSHLRSGEYDDISCQPDMPRQNNDAGRNYLNKKMNECYILEEQRQKKMHG